MVSSGTVRDNASSLQSTLSTYQSSIDGLNGNWKGPSYDNLTSKASSFVSEYQVINTQMESFASACDLYEQYQTAKTNYDTSVSNYNKAVGNNDSSSASTFQGDMAKYEKEMKDIKAKILEALNSAKSTTLTATKTQANVSTPGSANANTNSTSSSTTSATPAKTSGASSNAKANAAVEWAKSIAADDSYGYINGGMGDGGYDCTQFVHAAYQAAGLDMSDRGNHNQSTIVDYYTGMGFTWHPGTIDPSELQAGDVLVNQEHHAEMYIGNGQKIGAHNDYDGGAGDSQGNEISIDDYKEYGNGGWDGYLRYEGA